MAKRVRAIRQANPGVQIRIIPTVHEGCGGGQALFSKGYYRVPDIDAAVKEHWKGLHRAAKEALGQKDETPPFEITALPLRNMRPPINVHYADMALVAVIDPELILRVGPLIASDLFPHTYQINGDYLVDDPEAIGQIAALAADISSGKHALPGLVTPERPFRYILLGNPSTASAIARVGQELDRALRHSGRMDVVVRSCIV